jgi:hypothetical protein
MATIIRVVLELNTIIGFTCNLQFGVSKNDKNGRERKRERE